MDIDKCLGISDNDQTERRDINGEMAGCEMDSEYMACTEDIRKHPVFESMDQYIQHGTTTCRDHCIRVSYLGYKICRAIGGNWRSAARAGLLHDLFLYDWHTHARDTGKHLHGLTHPKTALANAGMYFDLNWEERNIILRHMWPLTLIPPVTRAGFAIVWADKVCSLEETVQGIGLHLPFFYSYHS